MLLKSRGAEANRIESKEPTGSGKKSLLRGVIKTQLRNESALTFDQNRIVIKIRREKNITPAV